MFKTTLLYRLTEGFKIPDAAALEEGLALARYTPTGPTQEESHGWVEPRGVEHGPLLESIGGQYIFMLKSQTRAVPGSVVKEHLEKKLKEIEEETGRKPGKKEKRELSDEIRLSLLPIAFTKTSATKIWLDLGRKLLVIGTTSTAKCDRIATALIDAVAESGGNLALKPIHTQSSPAAMMAHWLSTKEAPQKFTVDMDCILKASDESKASVKYAKHSLDIDEIAAHIQQGKMPTQLSLTWNDKISFLLCDTMAIKKIEFLDVAVDGGPASPGDVAKDAFDGDVAIASGSLSEMFLDLFDALGGEAEPGAAPEVTAADADKEAIKHDEPMAA